MINIITKAYGVIKVKIYGDNVEKFLDTLCKKRISIWNLHFKNGFVTGEMKPSDFKKIRSIKHKTKTKIKITDRSGICFKIKKHSKRVGFMLGAVMFFVLLKISTLFVFDIKIVSNKPVNNAEILNCLNDSGLSAGVKKSEIDTYITAQKLLLKCEKLDWASVNIEGSTVTVNVNVPNGKRSEAKPPCNLIATQNGQITAIDVVSGETVVSIGDNVKKGDVLVTGISSVGESTVYLNSSGTVTARCERKFKKTADFIQTYYTDKRKINRKTLDILSFHIPLYLGSIKEPYISKSKKENFNLLGKDMPVGISKKTFYIKEKTRVKYSKEKLKKILENDIRKEIENENFIECKALKTEVFENEKALTVIKTVSAVQNIQKKVNLEEIKTRNYN